MINKKFSTSNLKPQTSNLGQTLVIVLLVMAVSLAVGVAISSRSISTVRQVSYSAQSAQALAAAEAGIEESLAVDDLSGYLGTHTVDLDNNPATDEGSYEVSELGGSAAPVSLALKRDETQQINLEGYGGSQITCYWSQSSPINETADASMEFSFISGSAPYTLTKYTYNGSRPQSENGFESILAGGSPDGGATSFRYMVTLSVPPTPKILRARVLYNDTTFVIAPQIGVSLPHQGHKIRSTGKSGETVRIVEVTKTLPALPSIFDYVLFSGSEGQPLEK